MRKLLAILSIASVLTFGSIGATKYVGVKAEEMSSENVSSLANSSIETSSYVEETTSENDKESENDLSQIAKDTMAVIDEILKQPVVIGGVSFTIGSLFLLVISYLVKTFKPQKLNSKDQARLNELNEKVANLTISLSEASELIELQKKVIKIFVDTIKNPQTKAKAKELLNDFAPIKDNAIEFAKVETEKVVEDTKQFANDTTKEIIDILNK